MTGFVMDFIVGFLNGQVCVSDDDLGGVFKRNEMAGDVDFIADRLRQLMVQSLQVLLWR